MQMNKYMNSHHNLHTMVLALLLLLAGAGQAMAEVNSDLKGMYISDIGSKVSSLTNGQWYLIRSTKDNTKYLSDPGDGSIGTGSEVSVESDASINAGQLFQATSSTLVSGNGLYLKLSASNSITSFTTTRSTINCSKSNWYDGFYFRSTDTNSNKYRYLYLNSGNQFAGNNSSNTNNNSYYLQLLPVTLAQKTDPIFGGWAGGDVTVDGTMQLGIWGLTFADLVLTSEDESIATVDASGLVTGVSAGTTNILMTCPGTGKYNEKVEKIAVTVNRKTIYYANMSVSAYEVEVGETIQMTVSSESDGVVTFSSSDETKATVDANGVIRGVSPGTVTISYSIGESNRYNAFNGGSQQITVKAATTTITSSVYYIMEKSTGKFLTRGRDWGYRSMVAPYGLPWRIEQNWDGTCKLYMYDMYTQGETSKAMGLDGYVDNTAPVYWTITGDKNECTLSYKGKYFAVNSDNTVNVQSTTADKWVFLTKTQYKDKLEAMQSLQDQSVAASQNIELTSGSLTAFLASNDFEAQDVTSKLESKPTEGGKWTSTKNYGSNLNFGSYGAELYQANGSFTQQVTGLEQGLYKVRIKALKRSGSNATCVTIGGEGYPLSDAYLSANGQTVCIKDWYSGHAGDANPNNTDQFVSLVNSGKYAADLYTTVGADGILDLSVLSEALQGYSWFVFNSVELTYYKDNRQSPSSLTISPSSLTLTAGETGSVTLDYGDWDGAASAITHTTPNTSVATISGSGTSYSVRAIGKGTTIVTFTLPETKNYRASTAELTITVGLASTNLQFDITSLELPIDGTATYLATTTSASSGAITYSSSNESVATVNELTGLVTAKKLGTATITATLAATNQFASATASYSLNVVRKQTTLQFRNVVNNTLSMVWGQEVVDGSTFDNAATTNSTSPISYVSDNFEVVTVDNNGMLTFHGIGTATITATVAQNETYQAAEARCFIYITDQNHYHLSIVNAPSRGVLVTIGSKTFTEDADFSVSGEITASMVKVATISSYTNTVTIDFVENNSVENPHIITVTYTLIPPTPGRFYRFSSYQGKAYLSGKASNVSGHADNLALSQTADNNAIIYVDDESHALFYGSGQYMSSNAQLVNVGGGTGASISFDAIAAANTGAFAIKVGDLYLRNANSYVEVDSKSVTGATDWIVEQVNALPVTLSAMGYGYGTLYSPVALQVPGGVSVFYIESMSDASGASDRDYSLKLEPIIGIIPAYTPVVIQGMPGASYDFPLVYSNTDAPLGNFALVRGTVPSILTSSQESDGTVYTLQPSKNGESVGFYPWRSSKNTGAYPQTVIQGFRAFMVYSESGADDVHFQFSESEGSGDASSIESIGNNVSVLQVYDLVGRKGNDQKKGLQIINGKKVLIK